MQVLELARQTLAAYVLTNNNGARVVNRCVEGIVAYISYSPYYLFHWCFNDHPRPKLHGNTIC